MAFFTQIYMAKIVRERFKSLRIAAKLNWTYLKTSTLSRERYFNVLFLSSFQHASYCAKHPSCTVCFWCRRFSNYRSLASFKNQKTCALNHCTAYGRLTFMALILRKKSRDSYSKSQGRVRTQYLLIMLGQDSVESSGKHPVHRQDIRSLSPNYRACWCYWTSTQSCSARALESEYYRRHKH